MANVGIPFERIPSFSPESEDDRELLQHESSGAELKDTQSFEEVPSECRVPCSPIECSPSTRGRGSAKKPNEVVVQLDEVKISDRLEDLPDHGVNARTAELLRKGALKELIFKSWANASQWPEFFDPARLNRPSVQQTIPRIQANGTQFLHNYVLLTLVLVALGAIMHPLAFITFFSIFLLYVVLFVYHEASALQIGKLRLEEQAKSTILLIFALCALCATGSGPVMLGLACVAACAVLLHSAFMISRNEIHLELAQSPRTPLVPDTSSMDEATFEDSVV
uniref:PRA1 family protein n=1 Tax=Erythrolobus australicus TaxID=1077150 RepID=A0A7S1XHW5_9RHOD|mmetsp:Transcript_1031/g.2969  ORF Transcript_1031/g.2969 Transcript_1031/m.2969 type:complete len:280 (+) Transcript_1031:117-956(+)